MSEGVSSKTTIQMISGFLIFAGLFTSIFGISEDLGSACCGLGVCGLVLGGLASAAGGATSTAQGKMVLQQDATGEWKWTANNLQGEQQQVQGRAAQYNDQSNQIMSRVIKEVRDGKKLEELEDSELDIVSGAYGINSGSRTQKIEALHNSDLAKKGLQLGAVAAVGGVGALGAAAIVNKGRQRAIERADDLRDQARDKLEQNIEQGKYKLNASLPTNADGQNATEVANNIILDQLSKQIRDKNLTPDKLIEIGDFNKDGKLDPVEISGALTAATGMSVPVFIVKDAIKDFDLNNDGTLDISELNNLWTKLGFELEEEIEEEIQEEIDDSNVSENEDISDEDIDSVMDEIDDNIELESEVEIVEEDGAEENQIVSDETLAIEEGGSDLTEEIDTEFEELIVEMESLRFSSERRQLMEKQESEYLINVKINSMERTLLGEPKYRGGQSVHGLIDGGPYVGVVKVPVSLDEKILSMKEGDHLKMWVKLVDFSPSLKRPVLEASEII